MCFIFIETPVFPAKIIFSLLPAIFSIPLTTFTLILNYDLSQATLASTIQAIIIIFIIIVFMVIIKFLIKID